MSADPRTRRSPIPGLPCTGKVRYTSPTAARRSSRHLDDEGGRVHVYLCPHCHAHHAGHHIEDGLDRAAERSARRQPVTEDWPW